MQLILFASSITIFEVICRFQELGIEWKIPISFK